MPYLNTRNPALRRLIAWRWPVVASIVLHGAVIAGSLYLSLVPASPDSLPLKALPENAATVIETHRRAAALMTPREREKVIEEKLPALNNIATVEVKTMVALIENAATGRPSRESGPNPEAEGEFDSDSATIYDIKRITSKSGDSIYEWVMVDRAGVALRFVRTESEMSDSERGTARAFELANKNPNLRILLDAAIRMSEASTDPQTATKKGR